MPGVPCDGESTPAVVGAGGRSGGSDADRELAVAFLVGTGVLAAFALAGFARETQACRAPRRRRPWDE